MKTKPTESASLLPHIKRVLKTGKPWADGLLHYPAGDLIDAVLTIPGMAKRETDGGDGEGFSINGWHWDWWQKFTHRGKNYTLSGCGYYGGHAFHISDE